VFSELTNYLTDDWKPIIDTDVDGEGRCRSASTPNDPPSGRGA